MYFGKRAWIAVLAAVLILVAALGCQAGSAEKLKVATGTTHIADIVQEVGGEKVEVINIVPPGLCPGHFDLKPADVEKLARARLLLHHDWQEKLFTKDLLNSVGNQELEAVAIAVAGNWMAPPVRKQAVERIAAILSEKDSANKDLYQANASRLIAQIEEKNREVQARLEAARIKGTKVLCAEMQQGFISWVGLEVVGTYGRPEELTPQLLQDLVDQGRRAGVRLVVDNLQSGPEAGEPLARELDVPRVTLSNFPGGFPGTDNWGAALDKNVELLLEALRSGQGS